MIFRLVVLLVIVSAGWCGQAQKITDTISIHVENVPLPTVLDSITYKSGYFFSYNAAVIPEGSLYSLSREAVSVHALLHELLTGTGLDMIVLDDQIILKAVEKDKPVASRKSRMRQNAVVKGWVRLKNTDETLAGVNVFIDGTTIGTITDASGAYELNKLPEGNHQIVFSHVGFRTTVLPVSVQAHGVYLLNTFMDFQTTQLPSVEITSPHYVSEKFWNKHYKTFEREFIGSSVNAQGTVIANKEALNFTYDPSGEVLKAYVEEPLEVINRALGYRVTCQLEHFEKNRKLTSFHIKARFHELTPAGRKEKRKWRRNREAAYQGSSLHFFRSLINDSFEQEGYRIYALNEHQEAVRVGKDYFIKKGTPGTHWKLCFQGTIYVDYIKEKEPGEYLSYLANLDNGGNERVPDTLPGYQTSELELKEPEVMVYSNGQVRKPADLIKRGYWSWERVADLMPMDYGFNK